MNKINFHATPTSIVNLERKNVLVATEENKFYLFSLKDFHSKEYTFHDKLPIPVI